LGIFDSDDEDIDQIDLHADDGAEEIDDDEKL
jgi:hypothetical protein